jgi:hypothetical protein
MPEFTTVSVQEAQMRTVPGRQGTFMNEYADYIQQLPKGQAGKLSIGAEEKHTTIRRRLSVAAKALHIPCSSSDQEMICTFGGRTVKNNHEVSAGIPDEQRRTRNQHQWIKRPLK